MSNKQSVLIVEDESSISNFMAAILHANQYSVLKAENGKEALMMIQSYCPEVILLDLGLPDMEGMEIIKKVREWSETPIVVVSARGDEKDKVEALDLGADDYITKPFATSELLARIRTAVRHSVKRMGKTPGSNVFETGELKVDFDKREVTLAGERIHLTQMEYKILVLLSQNAGKVMTYDSIIQNLWGPQARMDNQILRVNMAHIRRKIESNPAEPKYVFTEVGVGYRMREEKKTE